MSVTLQDITKNYGNVTAVADLNLDVQPGEFMSLVGPSGCGKTTTLRIIAGFIEPDRGTVLLYGNKMNGVPARKRQVGIVFQDYALFPNLTVFKNVAFGLNARRERPSTVSKRVGELLDMVQLPGLSERYPKELSGGQKQRVALARALAIDPTLLLLDEPLSALDAKVRLDLRYELRRIQRETGTTTVYVTHDQEEAMSVSDRVAVMNSGRIEQVGTPDAVYKRPATPFVADFIGTSTLLTVTEVDPARGQVQWLGKGLQTTPFEPMGKERLLLIRPENVQLHRGYEEPPTQSGPNLLKGEVAGRVFLGAASRYAIDVKGERFLVDTTDPQLATLDFNTLVRLSFEPENSWVI